MPELRIDQRALIVGYMVMLSLCGLQGMGWDERTWERVRARFRAAGIDPDDRVEL